MMPPVVSAFLGFVITLFQSRASLHLENLALRHQLAVYRQTVQRPRLRPTDRLFWVWLSRLWAGWQRRSPLSSPHDPRPATPALSRPLRGLSQQGTPGRPAMAGGAHAIRTCGRRTRRGRAPDRGEPHVERLIGSLRRECLIT
jgi:hypothetical protein